MEDRRHRRCSRRSCDVCRARSATAICRCLVSTFTAAIWCVCGIVVVFLSALHMHHSISCVNLCHDSLLCKFTMICYHEHSAQIVVFHNFDILILCLIFSLRSYLGPVPSRAPRSFRSPRAFCAGRRRPGIYPPSRPPLPHPQNPHLHRQRLPRPPPLRAS